jgi:hypothetical protein
MIWSPNRFTLCRIMREARTQHLHWVSTGPY